MQITEAPSFLAWFTLPYQLVGLSGHRAQRRDLLRLETLVPSRHMFLREFSQSPCVYLCCLQKALIERAFALPFLIEASTCTGKLGNHSCLLWKQVPHWIRTSMLNPTTPCRTIFSTPIRRAVKNSSNPQAN